MHQTSIVQFSIPESQAKSCSDTGLKDFFPFIGIIFFTVII